MPNCQEHEDCDLVCSTCGSYYCLLPAHGFYDTPFHQRWLHAARLDKHHNNAIPTVQLDPRPPDDMPDDIEAYHNERAEEMP